jgi:hypothetical protein
LRPPFAVITLCPHRQNTWPLCASVPPPFIPPLKGEGGRRRCADLLRLRTGETVGRCALQYPHPLSLPSRGSIGVVMTYCVSVRARQLVAVRFNTPTLYPSPQGGGRASALRPPFAVITLCPHRRNSWSLCASVPPPFIPPLKGREGIGVVLTYCVSVRAKQLVAVRFSTPTLYPSPQGGGKASALRPPFAVITLCPHRRDSWPLCASLPPPCIPPHKGEGGADAALHVSATRRAEGRAFTLTPFLPLVGRNKRWG